MSTEEALYQFIAITFDDGSVGIMRFNLRPRGVPDNLPGYHDGRRVPTHAAVEHDIHKSVWLNGRVPISWRLIAEEDARPHMVGGRHRDFRDALRDSGASLSHDLDRAKAIHADRLRAARAPLLVELDVEFVRALEQGKDTKAIAARKQALRDAPAAVEAARTIDELRAVELP